MVGKRDLSFTEPLSGPGPELVGRTLSTCMTQFLPPPALKDPIHGTPFTWLIHTHPELGPGTLPDPRSASGPLPSG